MENEKRKIIVPLGDGKNSNEPPIESLISSLETLQIRMKSITEKMAQNFQFNQEIYASINSIFDSWGQAISEQITLNIKPALEVLQQVLASVVTNISIPTLSEERKQELVANHIQWGKFGWTWFQDMPIDFYDDPPLNIGDANGRVKHLHSAQRMESIFNQLREQRIKHEDLESAIFCFQNRQYKACSLLLFGLIEAKMIKNRLNTERSVGKGAIRKLRAQFNEKKDEQMLYIALFCENLLACLDAFFERTDNFKTEPEVINRNFINHGVNQRRVRKRDCIQLFLVLNNLMYFLSEDITLNMHHDK